MKLLDHQLQARDKAISIMKEHYLCYIFGNPRIGKSLIALDTFKELIGDRKVLVITKKNAMKDWEKYKAYYNFDIINYHSLSKMNPQEYKGIIVDEAHNYASFPKLNTLQKTAITFCKNKAIIFLSGTPLVENMLSIYSQFKLSSYSPFKTFKNGYEFFRVYGISNKLYIRGLLIEQYNKANEILLNNILDKYIVRVRYEDANFKYQNYDKVIMIQDETISKLARKIYLNNVYEDILLDTPSKLYACLHRINGSFYEGHELCNQKLIWLINYVKEHENANIAIMCYFKEEQEKIAKLFKQYSNVTVLSSTKYCEGIDLSNYDHFILYSYGYSGAKFIQLRDRIVNITKNKETYCIIPLIEGTIDKSVYQAVSNKRNFNINLFNYNLI